MLRILVPACILIAGMSGCLDTAPDQPSAMGLVAPSHPMQAMPPTEHVVYDIQTSAGGQGQATYTFGAPGLRKDSWNQEVPQVTIDIRHPGFDGSFTALWSAQSGQLLGQEGENEDGTYLFFMPETHIPTGFDPLLVGFALAHMPTDTDIELPWSHDGTPATVRFQTLETIGDCLAYEIQYSRGSGTQTVCHAEGENTARWLLAESEQGATLYQRATGDADFSFADGTYAPFEVERAPWQPVESLAGTVLAPPGSYPLARTWQDLAAAGAAHAAITTQADELLALNVAFTHPFDASTGDSVPVLYPDAFARYASQDSSAFVTFASTPAGWVPMMTNDAGSAVDVPAPGEMPPFATNSPALGALAADGPSYLMVNEVVQPDGIRVVAHAWLMPPCDIEGESTTVDLITGQIRFIMNRPVHGCDSAILPELGIDGLAAWPTLHGEATHHGIPSIPQPF